jgi:hypothetical protein
MNNQINQYDSDNIPPLSANDCASISQKIKNSGDFQTILPDPQEAQKEIDRISDKVLAKWDSKNEQDAKPDKAGSEKNNLPTPLPDELLPVEPFEYDLLPETLIPWVRDICERVQCPPDFVGVSAMTALASLIGRKIGIRPQEKTDWTVIPNLWALIVGRPGVLKSPAQEQALAPLKILVAKASDQYEMAEQQFKQEKLAAKLKQESAEKRARKLLKDNPEADLSSVLSVGEVDAPILKRYMTNEPSLASLGALLIQNPNGLLVYRDEMVSLLQSLDKEGHEDGRGFYLTAWNGDSPYTIDRIGRGLNLHIPAVCLSMLGGTQPGRLSEYTRHALKGGASDDGLIQRFGLLVWPDISGKWKNIDEWPDSRAKNEAFKVFERFNELSAKQLEALTDQNSNGEPDGVPYLRFSKSALGLFVEWRTELEETLRGELHPALESHFAKYRKLIPALALILHLADDGKGPVTETALLKALAWSEYLMTHAQRAYGSISQPGIMVAKAILKRIKKGDLDSEFSSRDVYRPGWSKLSDKNQVMEGLKLLEDYEWIWSEQAQTNGRPKTIYHAYKEAMV